MRKNYLAFLVAYFFLISSVHAQCTNDHTRIERLKSANFTRDSIAQQYKNEIDFLGIMPHDTIADIGSYDGYYPSVYAIFSDSVSYYLNDITYEGFKNFKQINSLCEAKRIQKQSNSFKIALGNEETTNLPNVQYDKIIMRDALHHCKNMAKILEDVQRLMKKETRLFIFEPIRMGNKMDENLCKNAMPKSVFLQLMDAHNFILKKEFALDENHYWFMFEQKK